MSERRFTSRGVQFLLLAAPVAIGTAAAGSLVARTRRPGRSSPATDPLPPWKPLAGTLGNLAAFALTVSLALRTLGPGAPNPAPAALLGLVGLALLATLLAVTTVAPIGWLARRGRPLVRGVPVTLGLGLVAWWVTVNADRAWSLLSTTTLWTVAAMLGVSGGRVTFIPSEMAVGLDGFEVEVARQCSGMDGIGLFVLIVAIWLVLARTRWKAAAGLALLATGAVAAFLANAARIAALVWVGASGHAELALGGLHSRLGWILLVGLALGSIALAERSSWFRPSTAPAESEGEDAGVPPETGAYLGPLVAALATALITGVWADGRLDRLYGARILAAAIVLIATRRARPALHLSGSWVPVLVGAGVSLAWVLVPRGDVAGIGASLAGLAPAERWAWIGVRAAGSVLVIPVVEELAFRGFLLPWLVAPDIGAVSPRTWTWPAVLLSSLAFGAMHSDVAMGTLAGLAFAFTKLWRGRIGDAILAHAVANAGVALAALAGGRLDLWS